MYQAHWAFIYQENTCNMCLQVNSFNHLDYPQSDPESGSGQKALQVKKRHTHSTLSPSQSPLLSRRKLPPSPRMQGPRASSLSLKLTPLTSTPLYQASPLLPAPRPLCLNSFSLLLESYFYSLVTPALIPAAQTPLL